MIGWRELLIVLVIVLLIFGTKRLANIGKDLGEGIKGFKKGMHDGQDGPPGQIGTDEPNADTLTDKPGADPSGVDAADRREAASRDDRPRHDG